jgi:homoserine O-acetyltransferase
MRLSPVFLGIVLLGLAGFAQAACDEKVYTLATFGFESGERMEGMKVGYCLHGRLNAARDNAILVVPGTGGTRHSHDGYIGSGKAFDTDKYFVVAVDAIGGGTSSQPKDRLGSAFPRYNIRDMVHAQHELVTKELKLTRVRAVGGASMGSFQALEWAINHPDMVAGIVLMVPSAQSRNLFKTTVKQMTDTIMLDRRWNDGRYTEQPIDGLRAAGLLYFPWIVTNAYIDSLDADALAREYKSSAASFETSDAWGVIRRYQASADHDVSKPFGGDMAQALGKIRAAVLVLPSSSDRLLGVEAAREIARLVPQAVYAEVPSNLGHRGWRPVEGTPEYAYTTPRIREFIDRLGP